MRMELRLDNVVGSIAVRGDDPSADLSEEEFGANGLGIPVEVYTPLSRYLKAHEADIAEEFVDFGDLLEVFKWCLHRNPVSEDLCYSVS
jgi:hypothetical protein